ncbi:hypothetical protein FIBSPDRAFT_915924 [Athelia psychrophila]|uniref:PAS domain-containing protein n=1 Tax=Athelia psychrophila TaxID=1759441 RepID=A0A166WMS4_9AGAM|nr:hypothetical protein FIBSPDRAFT_915924 [Fibularhizoctonia sp. CBS 109695]
MSRPLPSAPPRSPLPPPTMPFEKYINNDDYDEYGASSSRATMLGIDAHTFSNSVQFQIPPFMLNGPPTLAHGGGAEALPVSMLGSPTGHQWFANNGFDSFQPANPFKQHDHEDQLGLHSRHLAGPSSSSYTHYDYLASDHDHEAKELRTNEAFADAVRTPGDGGWSVPALPARPQVTTPIAIPASTPRFPTPSALSGAPFRDISAPISAPSSMGLPVYSASGFDLLSILGRVATRPNPKIVLGPVDLTCAFVVVDVRRYDRPVVYASPTFCALTGYTEAEILGRNCRFLQSPDGGLKRGDPRRFVAPETVAHMYKAVSADKECQASIINYRKGGQAFINLVTIIPVPGGLAGTKEEYEREECVYHVGFQVDLTEQPNAILQKLKDGSYILNYGEAGQGMGGALGQGAGVPVAMPSMVRDRRGAAACAVSKTLRAYLTDPVFLASLPITAPAPDASTGTCKEKEREREDERAAADKQTLPLLLLEHAPDFVHVLSLKGSFLYVAPSVRHVLGFEADELLGRSVADYCHPADLIPLMRELKESSAAPAAAQDAAASFVAGPGPPRTVDLLFRARSKQGGYMWVECRGRLHVEPGKGRKAIILSGRARGMPSLSWGALARAGGTNADVGAKEGRGEWWGMVSREGTLLAVSGGVRGVLGAEAGEVVGRPLAGLACEGAGGVVEEALARVMATVAGDGDGAPRVPVRMVLFPQEPDAPVIVQVQQLAPGSSPASPHPHSPVQAKTQHDAATNIFEELETGRGSSWQYELQQLKFANQRLANEVAALESGVGAGQRLFGAGVEQSAHPLKEERGIPVARQVRVGNDWSTPQMPDYDIRGSVSLKRGWGDA